MNLLYLVIILSIIILFLILFNKSNESFQNSSGGYMITWEPPNNVIDQQDVTYNVIIKDDNGNIIDNVSGLTTPQYFFRNGDWNTKYDVNVSATNQAGTGNPSSINFISPQGFYNPTNIQNLQVLGRDTTSNTYSDINDGFGQLAVGSKITALSIAFDEPPSDSPHIFPQGETSISGVDYPYDNKTSVTMYGIIVYIPSYARTIDDCCILTQDFLPIYGGEFVITNNPSGQWQFYPYNIYGTRESCDYTIFNGKTYGKGCECPITIKPGDSIACALVILQPYSGAITSITKIQTFDMSIPDAPINVKYSWEPVKGRTSFPTPEDSEQFIIDHSDIVKTIFSHIENNV